MMALAASETLLAMGGATAAGTVLAAVRMLVADRRHRDLDVWVTRSAELARHRMQAPTRAGISGEVNVRRKGCQHKRREPVTLWTGETVAWVCVCCLERVTLGGDLYADD